MPRQWKWAGVFHWKSYRFGKWLSCVFWETALYRWIRRKEFSICVQLEIDKLKMIAQLWKTSGAGSLEGPTGWGGDTADGGNICLYRFGFWDCFFPWTQQKISSPETQVFSELQVFLYVQLCHTWKHCLGFRNRLSWLWEGSPNMLHRAWDEDLNNRLSGTN